LEAAQAYLAKSEADALPAMRNQSVAVDRAQVAASKAEVKQAEAAIAVAKAGLQIAQLHLAAARQALKRVEQRAEYRKVMAPADGIVLRQAAEPGSFAKLGGEPLFVISGTNILTMQTQIPERDALRVAPGQHARVRLDAERDGKPRDAKVSRVGYVIDPKTRTMLVEIDLPNSDGRLRPGMYGHITIDLETHPGALTLGRMSVYRDSIDGRNYCFRLLDGRAVKTAVVPAESNATRQEINSGVKEGDVVIARLENGLEDGVPVEIIENDE
jgi:RND family efflux transporter MFP subunit